MERDRKTKKEKSIGKTLMDVSMNDWVSEQ
jgi:hypothetical protein